MRCKLYHDYSSGELRAMNYVSFRPEDRQAGETVHLFMQAQVAAGNLARTETFNPPVAWYPVTNEPAFRSAAESAGIVIV